MSKETNRLDQGQISAEDLAIITEAVRQANEYSDKKLSDKFRDISWITVGVVIVVFIAFIQMIISLFQINNAAYKDYTQRLEERNEILNDYRKERKVFLQLLEKHVDESEKSKK